METQENEIVQRDARMRWGTAMMSGLIAGAIVWLLSHGTPWFTSGLVSPTLMGRDLKPPGLVDPYRSFFIILAQAAVSIGYAFVIASVAARLRRLWAVGAGAAIGLVLYALNFCFFHFLRMADWTGSELPVIVTHLVFGMFTAGLYRGLAGRTGEGQSRSDQAQAEQR